MKLPEGTPAALNEELPDSPVASAPRALPAGTLLDEFEVGEIIGEGSAVIVYAATDRARAVPVAIAEYMPAALAQRNDQAQVAPRTVAQADALAQGLKAFIDETRTLVRCDHPSLVRIMRLWEANATAYRAMPRYPARRLLDVRPGLKEPPDEEAVRALLDALLGALGAFHHAGGCHGRVTPSNILLLDDNRPLLLGPGAAGRAIAGDAIDAPATRAEPCFAPIEQIVESADVRLHPSVDLYALAGVARYWMSGELPAPAFGAPGTARRERLADTVRRLRLTWPRLHYSACLLDALDSALSIYPAERPQAVAQMRERLGTAPAAADGSVNAASTAAPARNDAVPSSPTPGPQPASPVPVAQDLDTVAALAPDPDLNATPGVVRIDDDRLVRTAFARPVRHRRRIAKWGAVVLLGLLLIDMQEFHREGQVGRVLDVLGIGRDTGAGDSGATYAPAVHPAAPVTPPVVADVAVPKPTATVPGAADSPTGAVAPAPPASAERATLSNAATAAPAEPAAVAQPPALPPPPTRTAPQRVARAPASPREVCGPRTQFSLYRCMQTQCSQRRWTSHPQCQHLRATDSVD